MAVLTAVLESRNLILDAKWVHVQKHSNIGLVQDTTEFLTLMQVPELKLEGTDVLKNLKYDV